ncbi:conserved hypothetical protein (plasmid) [Borreliella afzelii PKo]|uniref:Uncharacterized protein n=1 Tax=Borreliella afzelii (strain PKo) TaxID=390236 RepID=Q0SLB2_BORAP|nr:hypothetical protein BAPKO_4019 [Borreliella afzelii PKo]AEL70339.1 conserved hypothetical protein [Borreliella afzelii PKo]
MIVTLDSILNHLIRIFKGFKVYAPENNFECDIINTYNHPYLSKITTTSPNIIALKFDGTEHLFDHDSKVGTFYENTLEFSVNFQIYIIVVVLNSKDFDANSRMLILYGMLSDFLHNRVHKYTLENQSQPEYVNKINFYIYLTSNMQTVGLINLGTKYSNHAYSASVAFNASVKTIEILKEEHKIARKYN